MNSFSLPLLKVSSILILVGGLYKSPCILYKHTPGPLRENSSTSNFKCRQRSLGPKHPSCFWKFVFSWNRDTAIYLQGFVFPAQGARQHTTEVWHGRCWMMMTPFSALHSFSWIGPLWLDRCSRYKEFPVSGVSVILLMRGVFLPFCWVVVKRLLISRQGCVLGLVHTHSSLQWVDVEFSLLDWISFGIMKPCHIWVDGVSR